MNPETNIQPQKNTEPEPLNNTENNSNQAVTPTPQSQIQESTPKPADPQADQLNNPPSIDDDNNQTSPLPETPITPNPTNQTPYNQTPVQEPVTPPAFGMPEPTTSLDSEAQPPSGSMVGRKRILYISTGAVACLVIVSGVVFGLLSTSSKSKTTSSNVASQTESNTKSASSSQSSTNSSGNLASNTNNTKSTKKSSAVNPPIPFSNEADDVIPPNNNVPESDPTNQPGDPNLEPNMDDTN